MDKLLQMGLAVGVFGGVIVLVLVAASLLKGRRSEGAQGLLLAGPALLLVGVGLVYPAALTALQSFRGAAGTGGFTLANYVEIATRPDLRTTIFNTAVWVLLAPVVSTVVGLAYAVLVDRTRVETLAKTLVFLPMAISLVGASIIWKFMYEFRPAGSPQIGLLNQLRVLLGMEPTQFLANAPGNVIAEIAVLVWIQAGFAMTVLSAAIKAIPDDIIEAAKIDGATGWKLFSQVTLPAIRASLVVVLTTIAIGTLKVFDIVRTMTGGRFGDSVVANEFYNFSFRLNQPGLGSALAMILFILVLPIVVYNVRQLRKAA